MKKHGFLESFFLEYPYNDWIKVIDWLLQDDKFVGWTSAELKEFTLYIKDLNIIKNGKYEYGKRQEVNPSDYDRTKNRTKKSIVVMVKGQGETKDLVRHIRNGIAHGRSKICTRNGVRCLEIIDYGRFGFKGERGGQTAYLLLPVDFVKQVYQYYVTHKSI